MDRLTNMAVFKRAVDDGSFAAAARHFGISPEMAGAHVRALETRLGVRATVEPHYPAPPSDRGWQQLLRALHEHPR
jgi:hypothetical protein